MNLLLGILGTFSALLIATVLFLVWLYKTRIKRGYLYGLAASINKFPGRVSLRPASPFEWRKPGRAEQRVAALREAGFEPVGGYEIAELDCTRLFVMRHPVSGLHGVVFESQELGTWTDVLAFIEGQTQPVLAGSILKRGYFRLLPGDPKIHKPEADIQQLTKSVCEAMDRSMRVRPMSAVDFAPAYEKAFAEATDARLLAPMDDGEIRRLVMERGCVCGNEISDDEFAGIKQLLPLAIENELRLACGAQFLRETTLSAAEWQHATQRLLVVHDKTCISKLAGKLIYGVYLTGNIRQRLKRVRSRTQPRLAFQTFNASLPAWARYKKLGEVSHPVPADIYRAPIERPTA